MMEERLPTRARLVHRASPGEGFAWVSENGSARRSRRGGRRYARSRRASRSRRGRGSRGSGRSSSGSPPRRSPSSRHRCWRPPGAKAPAPGASHRHGRHRRLPAARDRDGRVDLALPGLVGGGAGSRRGALPPPPHRADSAQMEPRAGSLFGETAAELVRGGARGRRSYRRAFRFWYASRWIEGAPVRAAGRRNALSGNGFPLRRVHEGLPGDVDPRGPGRPGARPGHRQRRLGAQLAERHSGGVFWYLRPTAAGAHIGDAGSALRSLGALGAGGAATGSVRGIGDSDNRVAAVAVAAAGAIRIQPQAVLSGAPGGNGM